ncbi:MAG TPA: hypothetical protein VK155_04410 [Bacteroidales bacterium]|jgi:hypothetical protein|nr:hypothetical protein [Bacteroidales bacterium]
MAKKQVTWSALAKKDLYAALENHIRKYGDKKLTSLFYDALDRKIRLLSKGRLLTSKTSVRNVSCFSDSGFRFLFEEQEESILIHCVSEDL